MRGSIGITRGPTLALVVAAATFGLSLPNGGSDRITLAAACLLVWVLVLVGVASRVLPQVRIPVAATVAGLALLGVAVLTALSLGWTEDRGRAFTDLVRVSGYVGLFALVILSVRARGARPVLVGLGVGLAAVATYALSTRFFPELFAGIEDPVLFLASPAVGRLGDPIGYWNGLAASAAAAIVLLGWLAGTSPSRLGRALFTAALPLAILTLHLTDSRGGLVAVLVAIAVVLWVSSRRVTLLAPLAIGGGGGLLLVLLASARSAFSVGAPTPVGGSQGLEMLAVTLLVALAAGGVAYLIERSPRKSPRLNLAGGLVDAFRSALPRRWRWLAVVVVIAVVAVVTGPSLVEDFREAPQDPRTGSASIVSGSGRYEFWDSALDAWASAPLTGIGAGSFGGWWNLNGSLSSPVRDGHSLFLESLAELGPGGLALIVAFFVVALVAGRRRALAAKDNRPVAFAVKDDPPLAAPAAAALGVLVVGAIMASIDWTWELPAIFAPTVLAAALLTGAATESGDRQGPSRTAGVGFRGSATARRVRRTVVCLSRRSEAGWIIGVLGVVAIAGASVLLVAELELRASRTALERGDTSAAARHARDAATIEPWAAGPRAQLAAVEQFAGNPRAARRWLEDAVARAPLDPELWGQLSQASAQLGESDRALAEGIRSQRLDPTLRP